MKKIIPILFIAILFVACGNQSAKKETNDDKKTAVETSYIESDVADFFNNAANLAGKEIRLKGTVAHICAHGGKRMFLMHPDIEDRVKITLSDDQAAFNTELEGSDVVVYGKVIEMIVDEKYLNNWQAEVEAGMGEEAESKIHTGEEGHEDTEHIASQDLKQIEQYRAMLKESGDDHLSFYSVACEKYEVMK